MNPLRASSQWPSCDLHPSTFNDILNESELTEDEAEILSEEDDLVTCKVLSGYEGCFRVRLDQTCPRSKRAHHTVHVSGRTKYHLSSGAPADDSASPSAGDRAFTQKCIDLHNFICPLMELLHGLKTGRFNKGLTNFQQSVAMDRLQRILGILQRPEMGERYLHNLLQIEGMLKLWFPQVALHPTVTLAQSFPPKQITHWCQNQLSMPVKKRKLIWSDSDYTGIDPPKKKMNLPASFPIVMPRTFSTSITRKRDARDDERVRSTEDKLSRVHVKKETDEYEISRTSYSNCTVTQDKSVSSSADANASNIDTTMCQPEFKFNASIHCI